MLITAPTGTTWLTLQSVYSDTNSRFLWWWFWLQTPWIRCIIDGLVDYCVFGTPLGSLYRLLLCLPLCCFCWLLLYLIRFGLYCCMYCSFTWCKFSRFSSQRRLTSWSCNNNLYLDNRGMPARIPYQSSIKELSWFTILFVLTDIILRIHS